MRYCVADLVTIGSDRLTAAIDPLGAELTSLTDADGCELMTDADPAFWTGRAPILFPIVGALNGGSYALDGQRYPLPQHGFARKMAFETLEAAGGRARFRLVDSDATRAVYPFAFALEMMFALDGATLAMTATLANTGDRDLPASFGFHPAFAWPLPYGRDRAGHRIVFERDEPARLNRIEDALVGPADRASPLLGRMLALRDDLFADDALVWSGIESKRLRYGADDGPQLDIAFPGAPMLGIWTRPGARFVCVEPWWGQADPVGFSGEIWDKPGMMRLAPGERSDFAMTVTLVNDGSFA